MRWYKKLNQCEAPTPRRIFFEKLSSKSFAFKASISLLFRFSRSLSELLLYRMLTYCLHFRMHVFVSPLCLTLATPRKLRLRSRIHAGMVWPTLIVKSFKTIQMTEWWTGKTLIRLRGESCWSKSSRIAGQCRSSFVKYSSFFFQFLSRDFEGSFGPKQPLDDKVITSAKDALKKALTTIQTYYLKKQQFIGGKEISVADVMAFNEIIQLRVVGMEGEVESSIPEIKAWIDRIQKKLESLNSAYSKAVKQLDASTAAFKGGK